MTIIVCDPAGTGEHFTFVAHVYVQYHTPYKPVIPEWLRMCPEMTTWFPVRNKPKS